MLKEIDKGFRIGLILVDLRKSIDHMLDHTVLLQKKKNVFVFGSQSLNGFNHISQTNTSLWDQKMYFGLPWISIIGPFLFLIYMI